MRQLGVAMNLTELGMTGDMIDGLVGIMPGGYKVLNKEDIARIFQKSL